MGEDNENVHDLDVTRLPYRQQKRYIRHVCDLVCLDIALRYGLDPAELMARAPDPFKGDLEAEDFRDQVELLALNMPSEANPLAGMTDPDQIGEAAKALQTSQKEESDGNGT